MRYDRLSQNGLELNPGTRTRKAMTISAEKKQELVKEFQREQKDTGSPEVQIAILTQRISGLTTHLQTYRHDFASRRGLVKLVSKRNHLLKYLRRKDLESYRQIVKRLGLRR